jgi:hypothetical protein
LERTSTAIGFFLFFCFDHEFLKRVQSSEPLNTKMPLISSFFDRQLLLNPFFLLTGALLFDEKISQSAALFGLECGMLEFFKYSTHEP